MSESRQQQGAVSMALHARCHKEAAIDAFPGDARRLCDDQFAVLPEFVLGFVTIGDSPSESEMRGPSTVVWRPARLDYAPSDSYPWLPRDVREVTGKFIWKRAKKRQHHIFVRGSGQSEFIYAGEAHLGSYGGPHPGQKGDHHACFTLNTKLSREAWLQCDGYQGWQVEINHQAQIVDNEAQLDAVLQRIDEEEYSHLCMTRYEEDSLDIHTNSERAWLMYLREPEDCGLYLDAPGLGEAEEHFQCGCGISLEFPASQTATRSQAAEIARSFFRDGELPSYVRWSEM